MDTHTFNRTLFLVSFVPDALTECYSVHIMDEIRICAKGEGAHDK